MRRISILLAALVISALLAGCSLSGTQTFKDKDGEGEVKIDKDKGSYKYKNDKGEGETELGDNVKLPKDFPKGFPIYKDAKLTFASTNKSDKAQLIIVTHETKDGLSKVSDFYKNGLEDEGYTIENTFETGNMITQTAVKDKERVIIAVTEKDGKTTIATNITREFK